MHQTFRNRRRPISLLAALRANSLSILTTLLYLAALILLVYTVEDRYYNEQKKAIIFGKVSREEYFDAARAKALTNSVRSLFSAAATANVAPETLQRPRAEVLAGMQDLLDNSPNVVAVAIEKQNGEVIDIVTARERLRTQHDWSNSLLTPLSRRFETTIHQSFTHPAADQTMGRLRITITTARDDAALEALTARYWRILLGFILLLTLIYYALLRFSFSPLRRVTLYMQHRDEDQSPIIPHPKSLIERAYNDLARDATLTRFSKELRDMVARDGVSYAEPVLETVPGLVERFIGIEGAQVWILTREGQSKPWRAERHIARLLEYLDEGHFGEQLVDDVNSTDPTVKPEFWSARLLTLYTPQGNARPYFCDILSARPEVLWLLVVHIPPTEPPPSPWWIGFLSRTAQELRYALSSIEDQRRLILQEKSKANISLSRNLGHDLTNIIATSKLDLMTVKTFLSLPPAEISASPNKEKLFRESLEALLNNTRFLQEIVNLYRSFSFLQKPKFEEVEINELVADVVKLYRPSLSRTFHVDVDLKAELAPIHVEPRLLRLALFNLMQNASDAIKRSSPVEKPEGRVKVRTGKSPDGRFAEITVEDTGPGIRDPQGNLMSKESIWEIFRLGYSTKANQEGEGLGLNWVQTIVREFHGGEIMARNLEQGGAAFTIRIPVAQPAAENKGTAPTPARAEPQLMPK